MKLIFRSNDIAEMAFAEALLKASDVRCFIFDENMSILEGSINLFPKRLMVADIDYFLAREILEANNLDVL